MARTLTPSTVDRRREAFCQAQRAPARGAGIHWVPAPFGVSAPLTGGGSAAPEPGAMEGARRKLLGQVATAIGTIREALTTREYDRSMATRLRAAWKVLK